VVSGVRIVKALSSPSTLVKPPRATSRPDSRSLLWPSYTVGPRGGSDAADKLPRQRALAAPARPVHVVRPRPGVFPRVLVEPGCGGVRCRHRASPEDGSDTATFSARTWPAWGPQFGRSSAAFHQGARGSRAPLGAQRQSAVELERRSPARGSVQVCESKCRQCRQSGCNDVLGQTHSPAPSESLK
jgi:hypothetical protein